MKRFWTDVDVADGEVRLDGRPLRTPRRQPLALPTPALADAVAAEWRAVEDSVDPRRLPLTGLANAATDIVAPDPAGFAAGLARYGESDLLAYRAESPAELVAQQAAAWDPLLDWLRRRYDVHVSVTAGVMHCAQPPATVARLREAVAAHDPFVLAGLSPIVTIGGSLVAALALVDGAAAAPALWDAVTLDERWQEERWGEDALATRAREARRAEWDAAARFLALLG